MQRELKDVELDMATFYVNLFVTKFEWWNAVQGLVLQIAVLR